MTQRIINRVLSLVCLCCCFQNIMYAQEETGRRAYTLFDNTGKEITYGELIRHLSGYDIVFLGEIHNCWPVSEKAPLPGLACLPMRRWIE